MGTRGSRKNKTTVTVIMKAFLTRGKGSPKDRRERDKILPKSPNGENGV